MAARSETDDRATRTLVDADDNKRRSRAWRYAPLIFWMGLVLFASTGTMSASNTSRIIEPLVRWLFPRISEARVETIHFVIRKCAHFTEYAILALLAARAFLPSSKEFLRRHWLAASLALVVCVSLADEYNQSFNPARTGTIKDSALDTIGGLTALAILAYLRARHERRGENVNHAINGD
jgi:VanZ family protein